ncbi:Oxo-4-hydroxy-4-carboxy-5-ureidoimidazoline decarboxylase [Crepidotus variabilis]|uniref:Oxo-4-hydroxy-4-carboxy-5-ureidoimidazoline decarboxylase n=1 Tax=Crepidotus variabilis TaxID=179855 RepID=A0A9P6ENA0_9AGAR|nr:Oxo-4-hydroxy-4-carboxy-5-ureidoimidazoline decarboxylase [Crepidotus variabilis]
MSLPTLASIQNSPSGPDSPLAIAFNTLFEHSPILVHKLEPQLHAILTSPSSGFSESAIEFNIELTTYIQLIDLTLFKISTWDPTSQAEFISGHPRIGEKKNLSKLSASEQGGLDQPTPPELLARLAHLNKLYEVKYPGLRYITFVNGRSREMIAREMEDVLGVSHSPDGDTLGKESVKIVERGSTAWLKELERAVGDVGKIAKSRLSALGIE